MTSSVIPVYTCYKGTVNEVEDDNIVVEMYTRQLCVYILVVEF